VVDHARGYRVAHAMVCAISRAQPNRGRQRAPPDLVHRSPPNNATSQAFAVDSLVVLPIVNRDAQLIRHHRSGGQPPITRSSPRSSPAVSRSGDANQLCEMQVLPREPDEFHATVAPLKRVSKDGRLGRGDRRITVVLPHAKQRSEPGSSVRARG